MTSGDISSPDFKQLVECARAATEAKRSGNWTSALPEATRLRELMKRIAPSTVQQEEWETTMRHFLDDEELEDLRRLVDNINMQPMLPELYLHSSKRCNP